MRVKVTDTNLATWLANATECRNIFFQALDLTVHDSQLAALPQADKSENGCVFIGCKLGPRLLHAAGTHHALIFPELPDRKYIPYRRSLYDVAELYEGYDSKDRDSYFRTPDWQINLGYLRVGSDNKPLKPTQLVDAGPDEVLARRLHDHFITEAMNAFVVELSPRHGGKGVVAFMGGHDSKRSDPVFEQIVRLSRELTQDGFLVASGGGPGLMEAANLGGFLGHATEREVRAALTRLTDHRSNADTYQDPDWLAVAWEVRRDYLSSHPSFGRSLGVPTWFYGHEPPNVFASHVAKYFENSMRQEGLLAIATHGIVFAKGNAGTVQELFQDGCQNFYSKYGFKSPMILLGRAAWNPSPQEMSDNSNSPLYPNKPAWPLLSKLARMQGFSDLLTLTDNPKDVLAAIRNFRPPDPFA